MTLPSQLAVDAPGDMYGIAEFSNGGCRLSITEGGGYTYGGADGFLEFELTGEGEFIAKGQFSAASNRTAGHEPTEMINISGVIPYMRGHVLGSNGSELLRFGLFKGSYQDESGSSHNVRASAYLIICIED